MRIFETAGMTSIMVTIVCGIRGVAVGKREYGGKHDGDPFDNSG